MDIWKIGSRWSDTGEESKTVLNIFDKHGIVFAGKKTNKIMNKVKEGDLIAISDGLQIVRVGKVLSSPRKITDFEIFDESDKARFHYNDWVVGFRVSIFKLDKDEMISTKMGTFHAIKKDAKKIEDIYNNKILKSSL